MFRSSVPDIAATVKENSPSPAFFKGCHKVFLPSFEGRILLCIFFRVLFLERLRKALCYSLLCLYRVRNESPRILSIIVDYRRLLHQKSEFIEFGSLRGVGVASLADPAMGASWHTGTLGTTARRSAILHEDPVVLPPGTRYAVIDKLEMDAHFASCLWKEKRRLKAPPALDGI